jgi:hypothetical protein
VAVFRNRFPALTQGAGQETGERSGPLRLAAGSGRCEVVVFSPDHDASFADLSPAQAGIVMAAWADRTAELSRLPGVEQVYCFENRGPEIGVTLSHPHGQIYAYPFLTPRTSRTLGAVRAYRDRPGRDLVEDVLAAERADGSRIVVAGGAGPRSSPQFTGSRARTDKRVLALIKAFLAAGIMSEAGQQVTGTITGTPPGRDRVAAAGQHRAVGAG